MACSQTPLSKDDRKKMSEGPWSCRTQCHYKLGLLMELQSEGPKGHRKRPANKSASRATTRTSLESVAKCFPGSWSLVHCEHISAGFFKTKLSEITFLKVWKDSSYPSPIPPRLPMFSGIFGSEVHARTCPRVRHQISVPLTRRLMIQTQRWQHQI